MEVRGVGISTRDCPKDSPATTFWGGDAEAFRTGRLIEWGSGAFRHREVLSLWFRERPAEALHVCGPPLEP